MRVGPGDAAERSSESPWALLRAAGRSRIAGSRGRSAVLTMREAVTEVEHEWEHRPGKNRLALLRALLRELCE